MPAPVSAGTRVFGYLAAANRDENRHPDPYAVNFHQEDNAHVSFGPGGHRCLGSRSPSPVGRATRVTIDRDRCAKYEHVIIVRVEDDAGRGGGQADVVHQWRRARNRATTCGSQVRPCQSMQSARCEVPFPPTSPRAQSWIVISRSRIRHRR
jgi:hypothetical protein